VKQTTKAVLIVAGAATVVAAAIVLAIRLGRPRQRPRGSQDDPSPEAASAPAPVRLPVQFTRKDLPGAIVEALEYVVRKGRVQAAAWPLPRPRYFCVMVDGKERYYELDRGMQATDFGGLAEGSFRPLPPEMSRTTSVFRAVAKGAVPGFNEDRGDRILILLCPQDDWPKVSLRWPPVTPRQK